ncbi:MAG TPA: Clp protease N-terminal domain-containing protein [Acidobacteriaceae bacterium]
MFERYTEAARRAIYFARTEALARESPEIATADILLGLTYKHYEDGSPFAMLHDRRDELRALLGSPPIKEMPQARDIPLARESKIVLAYAAKEVDLDKQFSLEPHHLLRGIVRGGDSAATLLSNLGWDIETLRSLSKQHRKLFPLKRPSLRRVLKYYRRAIIAAVAVLLVAALIFYLRWQQR